LGTWAGFGYVTYSKAGVCAVEIFDAGVTTSEREPQTGRSHLYILVTDLGCEQRLRAFGTDATDISLWTRSCRFAVTLTATGPCDVEFILSMIETGEPFFAVADTFATCLSLLAGAAFDADGDRLGTWKGSTISCPTSAWVLWITWLLASKRSAHRNADQTGFTKFQIRTFFIDVASR
tara:strand:+ start:5895 stop:6428 length:534 start_codon:yes stop_codon:yes gene_type:complete